MNILLTTRCNRRECAFCFERGSAEAKDPDAMSTTRSSGEFMDPASYRRALRLAEKWGEPRICLLGGEPTQHPMIGQFVRDALRLGKQVLVATNGVIQPPQSDELRRILYSSEGQRLLFLVNPCLRAMQPRRELDTIEEQLVWMQAAATLSITVWNDAFDLSPYVAMVPRFHLNTMIRIGLAHPALDRRNEFAAAHRYAAIGAAIKAQARSLRQAGVRFFCDCGFVPCMFAAGADESSIRLGLAELADCRVLFKSACNPLPDIHPDLSASHCLPLASRMRLRLPPDSPGGRSAVVALFNARFRPQAAPHLFSGCATCRLRVTGECSAGCLAHRLSLREPA
jgi:organic radical activating enzyme